MRLTCSGKCPFHAPYYFRLYVWFFLFWKIFLNYIKERTIPATIFRSSVAFYNATHRISVKFFTEIQSEITFFFISENQELLAVPNYGIIRLYHIIIGLVKRFLALSLFMALTFWTNYHNSAVSFDNFALIAHRFYRRSDFHFFFLLVIKTCFV